MADETPDETDGTLGTVTNAFNILETIRKSGPVGVSELSRELELPKSTTYVYLKTLRKNGFVAKEENEYSLSYRFLEYGGGLRSRSKIYQVSKLEVDKLAERTGEVASLGIEEEGLRVFLYKSGGPEALHDNAPVGEYTNLHWTALGKAILAEYPESRVDAILDRHGLPRANEHTITDRSAFKEELDRTRERGYSIEDQDRRKGVVTVGVPIIDRDEDEVVAAISVSGPKNRMEDAEVFDDIVDELKKSANIIELRYSHY